MALLAPQFAIGQRYINRGGAVLRVVGINPDGRYRFITLVIERMANGQLPDAEYIVTVGPDGFYCAGWPGTSREKSPLDLIAQVAEVMAA